MAWLIPVSAWAQTPATDPGAPRQEETISSLPPAPRWLLSTGLSASWDTNPRFVPSDTAGSDAGSLISGLHGRLSHTNQFARGNLSLEGEGGFLKYKDAGDLNEFNYGILGTGSYKPWSHTTLSLGQGFSSTLSGQSRALVEEGVVLPQVLVERYIGTGGISTDFSPRTFASAGARYERVSFPNGELIDGSQFSAEGSWGRKLSERKRVSLVYTYSSLSSQGVVTTVNSGSLLWEGTLSPRWRATASLGVLTVPFATGGRAWDPKASASLSAKYKDTTLEAGYSHDVNLAFGYGRERLADLGTLSLDRRLSKDVGLSVFGTASFSHDPSDPLFLIHSQDLGTALRWSFSRSLSGLGRYTFRHQSFGEPALPVTSNVVAVEFSYSRRWK